MSFETNVQDINPLKQMSFGTSSVMIPYETNVQGNDGAFRHGAYIVESLRVRWIGVNQT